MMSERPLPVEMKGIGRLSHPRRASGNIRRSRRRLQAQSLAVLGVVASLLVFAGPMQAQPSDAVRWMLDVEPLSLLSSGIGGAVRYLPTAGSSFAIGLSGVTQEVGGFAQDVVFNGADELDTRLTWALGAEVLFFLRADRHDGFHIGGAIGIEEFRARSRESPRLEDARRNGFATFQVGYVWYPGLGRLFINPRVGGITTYATDRERTIGDTTYELERFFPSAWLRVGIRL